jgi:Fur family ferric uptake transcriptional regulator
MKRDQDREAREILKGAKLYRTACRVAILKALGKAGKPVTQEQVGRRLAGRRFDKATIYRALESLVKAGLVHKVFVRERAWHFELSRDCSERQCHPHFTCTSCGETRCLTGISVPMARSPAKGFVIKRQEVRLEGLCPKCV